MRISTAVLVVLLVVCVASTTSAARRNRKNRGCRYDKGTWSECNTDTNTRTLTKTLVGNTEGCQPTKTKTKRCPTKCKYVKSQWSECDSSNERHMTLTLNRAKSAPSCPETKEKTAKCRFNERPAKGCKYTKTQWSACDNGSRQGTKTLRKGGESCKQVLTRTSKCT